MSRGQTGHPSGAEDLAEAVQAEDEEHVERDLLGGASAAQAREKGGRGDAEPEDEGDGEAQMRGCAGRQWPQEGDDGHDGGGGQDDLSGAPAHGQVEDGTATRPVGLLTAAG